MRHERIAAAGPAGTRPEEFVTGTDLLAAVLIATLRHGATIDDRETLACEAEAAFRRDGFTLLACRIDAASYEGAF